MHRFLTAAATLGVVLTCAAVSTAAITVTPDALPAGDTVTGESAPVFYTNYSGAYPSVQVDALLGSNDSIGFTASFQAGDLPDSTGYPGLRLVERVTNNTSVPWTDFHVAFDNPVSIFVVTGIPETYTITGNIPNFVGDVAPGVATIATGASNVDFVFNSPISPGGSFGMYIAFSPTNFAMDGSTHIREVPSLPEPSAIVLAALGTAALLVWRRCRLV